MVTAQGSKRRVIAASDALPPAVAQFAVIGLLVAAILVVAGSFASRRAGTEEGIRDAREMTQLIGRGVVQPVLSDGLLTGDKNAVEQLDAVVRARVLDGSVARVKLWRADGTIIYSDEARLTGVHYPLRGDEQQALRSGAVAAEVTDAAAPENGFERPLGKLLEVYLPLRLPDGTRVLFEAYYRYEAVSTAARAIWTQFLPIVAGGLLLFELAQLPLAWRLGRRVEHARTEREHFLRNAIESSELERRRLASDLHDGVVQDLAGVSYTLAAAADLIGKDPDAAARALGAASADTRAAVRALRSLLVEIYPPNLADAGLETALSDLLARLNSRGVAAELMVDPDLDVQPATEALVYRAAQEALRNVAKHADARRVEVLVRRDDGHAVLEVADDGVGFAVDNTPAGAHLGLRLLEDLAADSGGTFDLDSGPGRGTRVRLEVPV